MTENRNKLILSFKLPKDGADGIVLYEDGTLLPYRGSQPCYDHYYGQFLTTGLDRRFAYYSPDELMRVTHAELKEPRLTPTGIYRTSHSQPRFQVKGNFFNIILNVEERYDTVRMTSSGEIQLIETGNSTQEIFSLVYGYAYFENGEWDLKKPGMKLRVIKRPHRIFMLMSDL